MKTLMVNGKKHAGFLQNNESKRIFVYEVGTPVRVLINGNINIYGYLSEQEKSYLLLSPFIDWRFEKKTEEFMKCLCYLMGL